MNQDPPHSPAAPSGMAHDDRYSAVVAEAQRMEKERLTGVGGWLIVYITIQILSLLSYAYGALNSGIDEIAMFSLELADSMRDFHNLMVPLNGALHALMLFTLFLMFNRKKSTPKMTLTLLTAQSASAILGVVYLRQILSRHLGGAENMALLIGIIAGVALNLIWIAYFMKSKRVAYTFTE